MIQAAFAKGELGEGQAEKLVPAGEAPQPTVPAVPPHAGVEVVPGKEVHELREDELTRVHASSSTARKVPEAVDSDDPS